MPIATSESYRLSRKGICVNPKDSSDQSRKNALRVCNESLIPAANATLGNIPEPAKTINFWHTRQAAVSLFLLSPRIFDPVSGFWHNAMRGLRVGTCRYNYSGTRDR